MRTFIGGFVLGVIVATVGVMGVARILEHGIDTIKTQSKELSK